ncbi:MAG: alpha/beta hydrolase fold domain-containing protein [Acidimicrobiia bacterium]
MASRTDRRARLGWVYLLVSINGAAYTLTAFRPPRRSRVLFFWSFLASWITIELAPYHLVWQMIATTAFGSAGALRTRQGKAGLVITLASWTGLAVSIRRSLRAREEIRAALRDLPPVEAGVAPHRVEVEHDIVFAEPDGRVLSLDVHRPADPAPAGIRRPALLQIHGGGWVIGFKDRQGQLLMRQLAARGWVCFNADYRLSPAATFPDHLVDVKRAIAWIRDHADEYGVDPGFVAVTGGSAGGHLTALAALTADDPRYQPGFETADTSVQAAVPFYGVYDFTNRNGAWPPDAIPLFIAPFVMKADPKRDPDVYADASPLDQVRADAPPFFVIHGQLDVLAPVEDARDFVARLREVSAHPVYYLELRGAQHAFETFASIRANAVVDAAARFLDAVWHASDAAAAEPTPGDVRAAVDEELGDATTIDAGAAAPTEADAPVRSASRVG